MPLEGSKHDIGYGIFQLTNPVPSDIQFWSWKENVNAGKSMIGDKVMYADGFWNNQIAQFNAWNNTHDPDIAAPANTTDGGITFSYSPTGNQKSYADAIAIKAYNGTSLGNYIVWQDADPLHPFWPKHEINEDGVNYVNLICSTNP